jgi:hypothetical protein
VRAAPRKRLFVEKNLVPYHHFINDADNAHVYGHFVVNGFARGTALHDKHPFSIAGAYAVGRDMRVALRLAVRPYKINHQQTIPFESAVFDRGYHLADDDC